ncbi:mannonate dehydratase [Algibacter amylolyticus]|uniref:Mannonate dehydratase n=1 Tax=Algibacter amylolyticus TaxID=1608400 RepID=A0A5M7B5P1_9FLAO|nr:mannonate dehydratase [Algibacter amylolyticus]KAA5823678.1 mannonate dehydratase [Algibacter amylolyticus]MBB5267844.1 mannonate dehydratase [Algibacter amylolyticus]TSJ74166.1 mannonate dehydratase [Algibacter amylolyticus]
MELKKTLRWFGEKDPISLAQIAQTGAKGVVTALHHIPNGEVWTVEEILKTKTNIESYGLTWDVVESLPVSEAIKKGKPTRDAIIKNYKESVKNLGKCGITTICYNFMPVLDWARTSLSYTLPNGTEAMYYQADLFAAFDIYILNRPQALKDYTEAQIAGAEAIYKTLSKKEIQDIAYNIIVVTQAFIDGAVGEDEKEPVKLFLALLAEYDGIDKAKLREHFAYFLNEVIPTAEEYGVNLAVHPDDPPFPLLGLPRIMSIPEDFEWLTKACPSLNNGITFCTGSLGARKDNNLPSIFEKFADRVHFLHLRSTKILDNGDFYETEHLDESVNLAAVMKEIIQEQIRRKASGRQDYNIPIRPDHGHKMLDDFNRKSNPGYPLIGRLKGLAELAGLETGMRYLMGND